MEYKQMYDLNNKNTDNMINLMNDLTKYAIEMQNYEEYGEKLWYCTNITEDDPESFPFDHISLSKKLGVRTNNQESANILLFVLRYLIDFELPEKFILNIKYLKEIENEKNDIEIKCDEELLFVNIQEIVKGIEENPENMYGHSNTLQFYFNGKELLEKLLFTFSIGDIVIQ